MRILVRNAHLVTPPCGGPLRGEDLRDVRSSKTSILCVDGRVEAFGREAEYLADGAEVVDVGGRLVTPALVDPHTHLAFAGERDAELRMKLQGLSYLEILNRGYGIYRTVEHTRSCSVGDLAAIVHERLNTMRSHGTFLVEAKSGYGLDMENEVKILRSYEGLSGVIPTLLAHVVPKGWEEGEYVEYFKRIIDRVRDLGLARFFDVFCDKGAFSVDAARELLLHARNRGFGLKVHAEELERTGATEMAVSLGATSVDHLEVADEEAIDALASSRTIAVLLPTTPLVMLGGPRPRARRMVDEGVAIAIGTDFNPNNWIESLQFVLQYSVYTLRLLPEEALSACTRNAALAVEARDYGCVAEGKACALAVWDVGSLDSLAARIGVNRLYRLISPIEASTSRPKT
ncbi:MAG: imidazolonepropionase [Thermoplasmata archaeon]|nr:MAG: imidazolonepropionase [Thermoplasmata archaeon]HDJ27167.1 imidazolonepropionase [Aciduliprofundum sp.]